VSFSPKQLVAVYLSLSLHCQSLGSCSPSVSASHFCLCVFTGKPSFLFDFSRVSASHLRLFLPVKPSFMFIFSLRISPLSNSLPSSYKLSIPLISHYARATIIAQCSFSAAIEFEYTEYEPTYCKINNSRCSNTLD